MGNRILYRSALWNLRVFLSISVGLHLLFAAATFALFPDWEKSILPNPDETIEVTVLPLLVVEEPKILPSPKIKLQAQKEEIKPKPLPKREELPPRTETKPQLPAPVPIAEERIALLENPKPFAPKEELPKPSVPKEEPKPRPTEPIAPKEELKPPPVKREEPVPAHPPAPPPREEQKTRVPSKEEEPKVIALKEEPKAVVPKELPKPPLPREEPKPPVMEVPKPISRKEETTPQSVKKEEPPITPLLKKEEPKPIPPKEEPKVVALKAEPPPIVRKEPPKPALPNEEPKPPVTEVTKPVLPQEEPKPLPPKREDPPKPPKEESKPAPKKEPKAIPLEGKPEPLSVKNEAPSGLPLPAAPLKEEPGLALPKPEPKVTAAQEETKPLIPVRSPSSSSSKEEQKAPAPKAEPNVHGLKAEIKPTLPKEGIAAFAPKEEPGPLPQQKEAKGESLNQESQPARLAKNEPSHPSTEKAVSLSPKYSGERIGKVQPGEREKESSSGPVKTLHRERPEEQGTRGGSRIHGEPSSQSNPQGERAVPQPQASFSEEARSESRQVASLPSSTQGRITPPRPLHEKNPKPVYPPEARKKGYEGKVILRVQILPEGRVGDIEVKHSSGYEILDRSALAAVKQWSFVPAMEGEKPISFWAELPVRFELSRGERIPSLSGRSR